MSSSSLTDPFNAMRRCAICFVCRSSETSLNASACEVAPDSVTGVRVAGVTPESAAAQAGMKSGDRIIAIDGVTIAGADPDARVEVARKAIGKHDEASRVKLVVVRDGKEKVVSVERIPDDGENGNGEDTDDNSGSPAV